MQDNPETDFDESGRYVLGNLQPGFHMVREIVPEGFKQTFPSLPSGYQPPPWGDANAHVVFVDAGATVEEIDFGNPQDNEVLVEMKASGVCHSDWHIIKGEWTQFNFPIVLGHEGAGIVGAVGPGVTSVKPGDHVLLA